MGEYRDNFKVIAKGRGPSPLNSVECDNPASDGEGYPPCPTAARGENTMSYTEEQLRQAAVSCFVNARDLYEDACLLEKPARYPRALVLAVIGAEEFVQSVVYTIQGWELSARATFRPSPLGAPGASPVTSQ